MKVIVLLQKKAPRIEISGSICIIGGAITTIEQAVEIINSIRITINTLWILILAWNVHRRQCN